MDYSKTYTNLSIVGDKWRYRVKIVALFIEDLGRLFKFEEMFDC